MIKASRTQKIVVNATTAVLVASALFSGQGRCADVTGVTFVRIAATGDDPPGITGPFTGFDIVAFGSPAQLNGPAVDETRRVAFVGRDTALPYEQTILNSGVFVGSGSSIGTFADRTLDPVGLAGPLVEFESPGIGPFGVVFSAFDASFRSAAISNIAGIFTYKVLAQFFDQVPGSGTDRFNGVSDPKISGQYVAFTGNFPAGVANKAGIFVGQTESSASSLIPQLFPIMMTGDDPPGPVGPFSSFEVAFDDFSNRGVQTAFVGCDDAFNCGLFIGTYTPTVPGRPVHRTFQTIVSTGDLLPGNASLLMPFQISYDGKQVTFGTASSLTNGAVVTGLYTADIASHTITKIIQEGEALPGAVGPMGPNGAIPSISDSHYIAFWAAGSVSGQGLYVRIDGNLRKIVDTGDRLDGKAISVITFGGHGAALNSLAFGVQFTDGSQGIYRADLTIQ